MSATVFLFCLTVLSGDITTRKLKWEPVGKVEEKYRTPLGSVFQLPGYRPDDFSVNVNGLYARIFTDEFEAVKCKSRFVVIDFSVRLFPENPPEKGGLGLVSLGWGSNTAGIFKIYDLIASFGIWGLHVNDAFICQKSGGFCQSGVEYPYGIKSPAGPFGLHTFRHIIDVKGQYQFSIDGDWGKCMVELPKIKLNNGMIYHRAAKKLLPFKVNSFCLYLDQKLLIELSEPTVRFVDKWDDLKKLPALACHRYPYRGYQSMPLKATRKNPDAWYAEAMEILYGDRRETHPLEGIKLLEKAVRKDHVLAEYQLGLCYYRGIGAGRDFNTAGKHLRRAFEFGITDAGKVLMYMKCRENWPRSIEVRPEDRMLLDPGLELELNWVKYASVKRRFQVARIQYNVDPDRKISTNIPNMANSNRDIGALARAWMAEMEDYSPALLFLARRVAQQAPEDAIDYLLKGEKLGSSECRLLHLQLRHRLKTLADKGITPADYVALLEYPEFWRIVYELNFPGKDDPQFQAGAGLLAGFIKKRRDWNTLFRSLSTEDKQNLLEARRQLTESFRSGNREAGYLLALLAVRWRLVPQNIDDIESWLQQVDDPGSALLKSEYLVQRGRINEALALLNRFSGADNAPVYDALVELYLRKNQSKPALDFCRKAAAAGSVEAYRILACAYQAGGMGLPRNLEQSNMYWRKFIDLDTARRNQAIFDLDYRQSGRDELLPDNTAGLPGGWHYKNMTVEDARAYLDSF